MHVCMGMGMGMGICACNRRAGRAAYNVTANDTNVGVGGRYVRCAMVPNRERMAGTTV